MNIQVPRKRLARIRCLQDCIRCFKEGRKLPECVCYVPSEVKYQCNARCFIQVYSEPSINSKRIRDLTGNAESTLSASGEEMCNAGGKWLKIIKFKASEKEEEILFDTDAWIMLFSCKTPTEDLLNLTELANRPLSTSNSTIVITKWPDVVVHHFSLDLRKKSVHVVLPDVEAMTRLQNLPKNWTIDHDEALVRLMSKYLSPENEQLGSIKNYVDSIDVSTYTDEYGPSCLTDGDPNTWWESDGSQGQHWIQLRMKKGTIIKKLQIGLDSSDDNYLPSKIAVQGGDADSQKTLNTMSIDWDTTEAGPLTVLENMTEHYPIITIKIKDCKCGIDTRIRDLKIVSTEERTLGFDRDFFKGENLCRFPILETYKAEELYYRSQMLQRFLEIVDSVLQYLVPAWEYSIGSYSSLEFVRQLLPLSKKRLALIDTFLKESSSDRPSDMPKLYINRRAAMEHKCDPTSDPEYKNSIFTQIYDGLKPKDRTSIPLNYRWSFRYDQWWECKFLSEGVIDQGGGFRDSLSDLAEELCPSSSDGLVPTPFFIRSPNQFCEDSNINRDVYVPNPSCREFPKYEWIGQIMGACLRGKENLVISLPSFVWKKLVGERVSWVKDYSTVDAATVKVIDSLETMESTVEFMSLNRQWTCTLSDGNLVYIRVDGEGNGVPLKFDDREKYCQEVRKARMSESEDQINAIRTGLLKVVPQAVLDLLTWQELEQRISGDPDISLEALRRATHYDDVEEKDTRVKYMWEALKNFSNEDRSRFLRFITGRRRLPASIYISTGRGDAVDCLPESSTCANMLYLPNYTSAKIAEEKLRYATYNCMDIDTDMNLWED
ncbi:E3 ubiquitin-protein ligase HECTD3-like isoform X2 [Mercenaria mercenaria]|uniref:E3 ubiquitin-protein ligase HECTD3-like isoform X2 n=1 Tax=Mercenaria mercenaria TaxID=6596 RepID=UPI00234F0DFF|nr:E3 ubiquitin-protein ligase HECTD3-like isoform X2 [Mercenaria mercenaria]